MFKDTEIKMIEKYVDRIRTYETNLETARKLNPNSAIYILSALDTLKTYKDKIFNYENEVQSIKKELSVKGITHERQIQLRAKWKELTFLKEWQRR